MSNQEDKDKRSKRLQKEENAIKKQMKIAKVHGQEVKPQESHRFAKHHALDCGNPDCAMCGNPRRSHKHGKTVKEYSFDQTSKWVDE